MTSFPLSQSLILGQETSKMHTELNKIISIVISVIKKIKQKRKSAQGWGITSGISRKGRPLKGCHLGRDQEGASNLIQAEERLE